MKKLYEETIFMQEDKIVSPTFTELELKVKEVFSVS